MKRIISILLVLCTLFIGLTSIPAYAVEGDGTDNSPYLISTLTDYSLIGTGVYTLDKVYKIVADIGSVTEPITFALGSTTTPFSGKIIGDKNGALPTLYFNINQTTDYQGLAAVLTGTVENIIIAGRIIGRGYVGSVAGWMKGGVVKGVTNQAEVYSSTDGAYGKYIGGIAGSADTAKSEITSCINEGAISLKGTGGSIGGIVGYSSHANNLISSCVNKGVITNTASTSGANIGGIVGYLNYGTVELCANKATVIATRSTSGVAGGIAGLGDGTILRSYNNGDVTALASAGGISGTVQYGRTVNITDCYNTGTITCTSGISGGILPPKTGATTTSITIKNTYNVGTLTGVTCYFITGQLSATTISVSNNYYLNTLTGSNSPAYGEAAISDTNLKALNIGANWYLFQLAGYKYPQIKGNYQEYVPQYGTQEFPYEISTIAQWYSIENDLTAFYVLKGNIGSESDPVTTSIATSSPFSGNLSGNGYHVYAKIDKTEQDYVGLISKVTSATIKEIVIDGEIKGNDYAGALIGDATGTTVVENCVNYANVTALKRGAGGFIGRIAGTDTNNWAFVKGSKNYGKIVAYDTYAGGIAGNSINYVQLTNCANFGEVESKMDVAGGIAGVCYGEIFYSYNNGKISSPNYAGGIAGTVRSTYSRNSLKYVYNTGEITGTYACGITSCAFDITSKGINLQYAYNIGKATYPIAGSAYTLTYNFSNVYYLDGNKTDDLIDNTAYCTLADLKTLTISNFVKNVGYAFPDLSTNPQLGENIDFNEINVTCGEFGTVTPKGTVYVRKGSTEEFVITPNDGYLIETVVYNSNSVAEGLHIFGDIYKPAEITDKSTLAVTFIKDTSLPIISNTYTLENAITLTDLLEYNLINEAEKDSYLSKSAAMTFVKFTMKSSVSDYGIVFSKTNTTPEIGASNCVKISAVGYGSNGMFGVFMFGETSLIQTNNYYSRAYLVVDGEIIYFNQSDSLDFAPIL